MNNLTVNENEASPHPKEIAQDTLNNLSEYLIFLEEFSRKSGSFIQKSEIQPGFYTQFTNLIDGVTTFTQAIANVKKVLRIGILLPVSLLEADLLSILKDLLSSHQKGQATYMKALLQDYLPKNLSQWREQGIPALIKSRDC